jgi:hypothetical protein
MSGPEIAVDVTAAVRTHLAGLPAVLGRSVLAQSALELARRLDAGPADREAVLLARELRQTMAELRTPEDATSDVERFLERIAAPDVGDATH